MTGLAERNQYIIDVEYGETTGSARLSVTLIAPSGESLHRHDEIVTSGPERPIYQALMTALDQVMGRDCEHLVVNVAPTKYMHLVDRDVQPALGPVEAALRAWTLFQLRHFPSVSLHGMPVRRGQASTWSQLQTPIPRAGRA